LIVIAVIGALAVYRFKRAESTAIGLAQRAAPKNLQISRLTSNGKALQAAISPDGKLVVYELKDGNKQSLWIRQVATGSNVQIIASRTCC
jgi:hypothetical protein